ncbi:MAG TPA: mechanosensitive ion channel family protein [Pyrinomonadaceae bacterium]|nr:mechanosensitive ion channel family protein [Pyrinomonadaceae bacterium]
MSAFLLWQQAQTEQPRQVREVFTQLGQDLVNAVPRMITGLVVFLIFYLIAWAGMRIIAYTAPRVKADTGVVLLLSRVYYYGILIFGLITALGTAGLNVNALVAGLGLTGFALGFALKDVLSNLLSGIMLLIYRPFHIGDQITMGTYEGTIRAIRMRDTVVRSYDGRSIIIPNTKLITEVVINNTTAKLIRESIQIDISPETDIKEARELILQVMERIPAVTGRTEMPVRIKNLDDDAVQLEARFWYDPRRVNKLEVKSEIMQAIKQAFDRVGIEVAATRQRDAQALGGETAVESREGELEESERELVKSPD